MPIVQTLHSPAKPENPHITGERNTALFKASFANPKKEGSLSIDFRERRVLFSFLLLRVLKRPAPQLGASTMTEGGQQQYHSVFNYITSHPRSCSIGRRRPGICSLDISFLVLWFSLTACDLHPALLAFFLFWLLVLFYCFFLCLFVCLKEFLCFFVV